MWENKWSKKQYGMLIRVEMEKQGKNTCNTVTNFTVRRYNNLICRLNLKAVKRNDQILNAESGKTHVMTEPYKYRQKGIIEPNLQIHL